jgi:murein tripeptide amidase MpaA
MSRTFESRKTRRKRGERKKKTRKCKNKWSVSTNFDAGNIIKKRCETIDNINIYTLEIKKDPYPKFTKKKYQNWYYFQVNNVKGKKCKFIIENLVNIDNDWKNHNVVYTYDNRQFYRHPTKLNEKKNCISWEFKPKKNKIWFSYYVPYSRKRVYNLNSKIAKRKGVSKIILGRTSLNNKIELLRFGKGLKHIFMIARQHPGETIGSWMLEGFLKSLFSTSFKQQSNILFDKFTFHIISMVNPDGVQLGHWYTQKHGHNCNREWVKKSCPEVKMISKYMKKYEGSLYFDFHGDEGCKKHFFTTCDSTKKDKDSSWDFFRNRMKHYNKYFDKEDYYKKAAHVVHGTFDCAWKNALTVEGCMKHNYKNECVTIEPLKIGKHLYKSLYDWSFIV